MAPKKRYVKPELASTRFSEKSGRQITPAVWSGKLSLQLPIRKTARNGQKISIRSVVSLPHKNLPVSKRFGALLHKHAAQAPNKTRSRKLQENIITPIANIKKQVWHKKDKHPNLGIKQAKILPYKRRILTVLPFLKKDIKVWRTAPRGAIRFLEKRLPETLNLANYLEFQSLFPNRRTAIKFCNETTKAIRNIAEELRHGNYSGYGEHEKSIIDSVAGTMGKIGNFFTFFEDYTKREKKPKRG